MRNDGTVAMEEFGVAHLLHKDRRVRTKDDMAKRWSRNYDFQLVGRVVVRGRGGACLGSGGEGSVAGAR